MCPKCCRINIKLILFLSGGYLQLSEPHCGYIGWLVPACMSSWSQWFMGDTHRNNNPLNTKYTAHWYIAFEITLFLTILVCHQVVFVFLIWLKTNRPRTELYLFLGILLFSGKAIYTYIYIYIATKTKHIWLFGTVLSYMVDRTEVKLCHLALYRTTQI